MTPQQEAALSITCASFGVAFDSLRFDQHGGGFVGAFIGLAYAECSPYGEVELWCDCAEGVPYGSCAMCPICSLHLADCRENRCRACGRCEVVCVESGCAGY